MTTPAVLYDHVPVAKDDVPIKNDHVSNPAVPPLTDEDDNDIDDNRMETILEDSSTEYVLVSADTPHYDVDDDDDDVDVVRRKSRNERHSGDEDTNEETGMAANLPNGTETRRLRSHAGGVGDHPCESLKRREARRHAWVMAWW